MPTTKPLEVVLKYWVLIVAVVAGISTAAIGGQKLKTVEEAVKAQVEQNAKVQAMQTEQKVLVERTKAIQLSIKEQKELAKLQQELLIKILLQLQKQPE